MYSSEGKRYRPKETALAGLYLIFLLATAGEFFYALKNSEHHTSKPDKVDKHEQIPTHLPEESKLDFIRLIKARGKYDD